MRFGIKTLEDFELGGKTVLCRVDINEPINREDNTLKDITRIKGCLPTLMELSDKGAKLVILAHQGSDIEYKNYYTLEPHAKVLGELMGKEVQFIDDVCGPAAREKIKALKEGEVLLLDNVRFVAEEQTLFELQLKLTHEQQAKTQIVTKLAPLADLYVCDAFAAAHRDQPTLCGFEEVLPSAMGRLFEKEYCVISELMESPEKPCTFVLGGAKISDAFMMMNAVLSSKSADKILTGGLVAEIIQISQGKNLGSGTYDFIEKSGYASLISKAKELYSEYAEHIILPVDFATSENGERKEYLLDHIPADVTVLDIGRETAKLYQDIIMNSKTVFCNGPVGVFEKAETEFGTKAVFEAIAESSAFSVIGGGDSLTAAKKYGVTDQISYICTGGGALIRFLSGEELPVVSALRKAGARSF